MGTRTVSQTINLQTPDQSEKYISVNSSGLMIYDGREGAQTPSSVSSTTNNVFIDDDSLNIRRGGIVLASFGADGAQIGIPNAGTNVLIQPTGMTIRNGIDEKAIFSDELFSIGDTNGRVEFTPTKTTFYGNNGQEIVRFGQGASVTGTFTQPLITNESYFQSPYTLFDGALEYDPSSNVTLNATINGNNISTTFPNGQDYTEVINNLDITYTTQTRQLVTVWRGSTTGVPRMNPAAGNATKTHSETYICDHTPMIGTEIRVQQTSYTGGTVAVTFTAGTSATKTFVVSGRLSSASATYRIVYDGDKTLTVTWQSGQNYDLMFDVIYCREGVLVTTMSATYSRNYRAPLFSFGQNILDNSKAFTTLMGEGLQAYGNNQLVVGRYNDDEYINPGIIIGNGTADNRRSTAFAADTNGDVYASGNIYINTNNNIYFNADDYDYGDTKIYAQEWNESMNLYLSTPGYISFYVSDGISSPTGKMYLYSNRLDLTGNFRINNANHIVLNKNYVDADTYDEVAIFSGVASNMNNLYLKADGYIGFLVGDATTGPSGKMYLYSDHLALDGYYSCGGRKIITKAEKVGDNISISANSQNTSVSFSVANSGWTPIGIMGWSITNATNSGAGAYYTVPVRIRISGSNCVATIRNNGSSAAKVKLTVDVLYVSNAQGV